MGLLVASGTYCFLATAFLLPCLLIFVSCDGQTNGVNLYVLRARSLAVLNLASALAVLNLASATEPDFSRMEWESV